MVVKLRNGFFLCQSWSQRIYYSLWHKGMCGLSWSIFKEADRTFCVSVGFDLLFLWILFILFPSLCGHIPFLTRYKVLILCVLDRITKFSLFDLLLHFLCAFLSSRLLHPLAISLL